MCVTPVQTSLHRRSILQFIQREVLILYLDIEVISNHHYCYEEMTLPLVVHAFSTYKAAMSYPSDHKHHLGNADIFNTLVTSYPATHQMLKISIQQIHSFLLLKGEIWCCLRSLNGCVFGLALGEL